MTEQKKQIADTQVRVYRGIVVSDAMDKTVVVKVVRVFRHPVGKVVRTSGKYFVHDEQNASKIGDTIEFCAGRPISKKKYMNMIRVIA